MREKGFNKDKQLKILKNEYKNKKLQTYLMLIVLSFILFIPFSWRETKLIARQIKVQIGKSTLTILSIKQNFPLSRELNSSPSISSFMDRVFSIFRRKSTGQSREKRTWKWSLPRRHN